MDRWEIRILYDGLCSVCRSEMDLLRRLDNGRQKLLFEDITEIGFDPSQYGTTMDQLMGQIHGVLRTGRLVKGMEVFRRAYDAVGLGWLLAPTNWPVLRGFFNAGYEWFASNRQWLTGGWWHCHTGHCGIARKSA